MRLSREQDRIVVSERDFAFILELLENPPPLNEKMKAAIACTSKESMTLPDWHEEPIAKSHRRQEFDCGDSKMNLFLQRYARQSHDQGASKTFCAIDDTDVAEFWGSIR